MKKYLKISGALFITMLLTGMIFSSCKKDENVPDDGKIDPSTIATTNLIAYFPFDGNATESIAALTPAVQTGVTYVAGRRGQAYQGADLAHLLYTLPAASKMKTLKSFSIGLWFKSPLVTGDPEPIFFQIGKSDDLFWGNFTLVLNRLSATADSLQFKAFFLKTGVEWSGQNVGYSNKSFVINKWMHMIFEYDATTSKYKIYKDGVQVVTNTGVEDRKTGPAPGGVPLGDLGFANADVINIGAWRPKTEGTATDAWMGWFKGNLDELRVYDKALSDAEALALYEAEVTQVNP
ncbi:MAG: LamG-like jellyroll fold domain-containing protein [Bacteroidales bacterium]